MSLGLQAPTIFQIRLITVQYPLENIKNKFNFITKFLTWLEIIKLLN